MLSRYIEQLQHLSVNDLYNVLTIVRELYDSGIGTDMEFEQAENLILDEIYMKDPHAIDTLLQNLLWTMGVNKIPIHPELAELTKKIPAPNICDYTYAMYENGLKYDGEYRDFDLNDFVLELEKLNSKPFGSKLCVFRS